MLPINDSPQTSVRLANSETRCSHRWIASLQVAGCARSRTQDLVDYSPHPFGFESRISHACNDKIAENFVVGFMDASYKTSKNVPTLKALSPSVRCECSLKVRAEIDFLGV
jgi:hypothetical protein